MILVTGGLGYIGSHVVLSLLAQGQQVVIIDNLANSSLKTLERLEFITGMYIPFVKIDIRNTPALNKVFEQHSIDAVIHTAGFKSAEESVLKPLEYYNDNVSCVMSLLRTMQRTGVRSFVHLSSLMVYGKSSLELNEDVPFNHEYANPYIQSQQMMETIIRDTFKTDDEWRIAILRLSNVLGAYERGMLGEFVPPLPKSVISFALQAASSLRDHVELQTGAHTEDGTAERSFVHVIDVCFAIHAALAWLMREHHVCEAFDISGHRASIRQLIEQVATHTHSQINTVEVPAKSQFLDQLDSNSEKASKLLGWKAQRDIQQMILDQWAFYQTTLN